VGSQQCLDFVAQIFVAGASPLQKCGTLVNWNLNGLSENNQLALGMVLHGNAEPFSGSMATENPDI
jgi:hypothetical protein